MVLDDLCRRIRGMQQQAQHSRAEWVARTALQQVDPDEAHELHYLLALSLDAQGRTGEAARHYACAIEQQLLVERP